MTVYPVHFPSIRVNVRKVYACACPKPGAKLNLVRSLLFSCCRLFYVLHICFSFIFCRDINKAVSFLFSCFTLLFREPFIVDYAVWALFIVESRIVVDFCVILVSCRELSHWQSYHIFFLYN